MRNSMQGKMISPPSDLISCTKHICVRLLSIHLYPIAYCRQCQMGDCDSAINDWLNACSDAPRLPASSTTHREMCERYDEDETCVLLCCSPDKMPNRPEDPDVEHLKRGQPKARPAQPSRKQPPRASSSGSQQHSSQTRHIEAFSLSRTPSLPPPANDPEMDFVASTAELNLNTSSSARSDTAVSTRPTSVSMHWLLR